MDWSYKKCTSGLHSPGGGWRDEKDPGGGRLGHGLGSWLDVGEGEGTGGVQGDHNNPLYDHLLRARSFESITWPPCKVIGAFYRC